MKKQNATATKSTTATASKKVEVTAKEEKPKIVLSETAPSEEITGKKRSRIPAEYVILSLIEKNPCNPTKNRRAMYDLWFTPKKPITVGEYKEKGGIMFDLLVAVKQGQARVVSPELAEVEKPKASKKATPTSKNPRAPRKKRTLDQEIAAEIAAEVAAG